MRRDWLELCQRVASTPGTYWSGGKKILRNQTFSFPDPMGPISVEEIGYTRTKMALLTKAYIHEESLSSAVDQWNNRRNYKPKSHWSTGFSCYNHILKSHSQAVLDGEESLGSVMGPCLQAVTISHTIVGTAEVDVFYRTTEVFKKFPADLVLIRDHMLSRFDFDRTPLGSITFHVANMTVSPTYIPAALTVSRDPIGFMESVLAGDPQFHRAACRWGIKLLLGEESKFNQARRAQRAIKKLMTEFSQDNLVRYMIDHYPEYEP